MLELFKALIKSMELKAFDQLFPHLAGTDRCGIGLNNGDPFLDGAYELIDFYCTDPTCDCQKVSVVVLDKNQEQMALISYGWNKSAFYRAWGIDRKTADLMSQGFLEPFGHQSEQAPKFLEAFVEMMQQKRFKDRFKNRYRLVKAECAKRNKRDCAQEQKSQSPWDKIISSVLNEAGDDGLRDRASNKGRSGRVKI